MGFPRDRAETAVRNIEFPEVNLAMEWLLNNEEDY